MINLTPAEFRRELLKVVSDQAFVDRAVEDYKRRAVIECVPAEETEKAAVTPEEQYRIDMETASRKLLHAVDVARRGFKPQTSPKVVWKRNSGSDANISYRIMDKPAVWRDSSTCWRCGARTEAGCEHQRENA